jgi:hypothetical protein
MADESIWTVEIRDAEEGPWRPMTAPDEPPPVYAWRDRGHAESDAAMFERSRVVEWKRVSGDAG